MHNLIYDLNVTIVFLPLGFGKAFKQLLQNVHDKSKRGNDVHTPLLGCAQITTLECFTLIWFVRQKFPRRQRISEQQINLLSLR